jgi:hypothetical protein
LAAPASAGETVVNVLSDSGFEVGNTVTLDVGASEESLVVTDVGTDRQSNRRLLVPASTDDTNIKVNNVGGFVVGERMSVGTGTTFEVHTVTDVGTSGSGGTGISFTPPLELDHPVNTSARGLGSGITFAEPLANDHALGAEILVNSLPAVTDDNILGIEGPIWSETLQTIQDVEFMAFPRLPILAELGWLPQVHPERSFESFGQRIAQSGARWQLRNQNFYPSTQIPWRTDVSANDIAQASRSVSGEIGLVAAPGATLAQVSAVIDWGDGTNSAGTITGTAATNKTANSIYSVNADHTYAADGVYEASLSISGPGGDVAASFTVVADTTAPVITTPGLISVDATSPAGTTAEYVVTASDAIDPAPSLSCSPASGSLFAIGDTTVTCTATDNLGNGSVASFTVHVRSAAEQLANLQAAVAGIGPGSSLWDKVAAVEDAVASGKTALACEQLVAFRNQLSAQAGKQISVSTAEYFASDALRISAVLGC